jgi:Predicted amidohydrolase
MRVALGQFAVSRNWEDNTQTVLDLMQKAQNNGADLLVLPEGILARDIADPEIVLKAAQKLDGPFMTRILEESCGSNLTVMTTIHIPAPSGKVFNTFVTFRNGEIIGQYRKLHLYDAFSDKESENVQPGDEIPALIDVAGFRLGTMTCYDVRFPELARRLVLEGADVLVLPAAWVKGPNKEFHWQTLVTARALENTSYMIAVGECGSRNIGASMVVDPLGIACVRAGEAPALLYADLDRERLEYARKILPVLENRRFRKPELS